MKRWTHSLIALFMLIILVAVLSTDNSKGPSEEFVQKLLPLENPSYDRASDTNGVVTLSDSSTISGSLSSDVSWSGSYSVSGCSDFELIRQDIYDDGTILFDALTESVVIENGVRKTIPNGLERDSSLEKHRVFRLQVYGDDGLVYEEFLGEQGPIELGFKTSDSVRIQFDSLCDLAVVELRTP